MESLFIQLSDLYKSQFWKIDPYDWFCGPWPHIDFDLLLKFSLLGFKKSYIYRHDPSDIRYVIIIVLLLVNNWGYAPTVTRICLNE